MKPLVILVGADKGGVGKTMVSRALIDYFQHHNIKMRAFDTEYPRGNLKRFHSDITEIVNINMTQDQMLILDKLFSNEQKVTIIDVRAGHMRTTLSALKEIGFLEAVHDGAYKFSVFHVLGPSVSSLNELDDIAPYVVDADYYLVKNIIQNAMFFEWDPQTYASYFTKVRRIGDVTIPPLNEVANEEVDLSNLPFSSFISNNDGKADFSFVLRGYVRTWLKKCYEQFDQFALIAQVRQTLK
jgi:hypothetical protein